MLNSRGDPGSSTRREEIAREETAVEPDDDFVDDSTMQGCHLFLRPRETTRPRTLSRRRRCSVPHPPRHEVCRDAMPTPTDDADASHRRGHRRDVPNLGIHRLMFQQHESYRKATCLFLATLEHEPCHPARPHPTAVTGTSRSGPPDSDTISHTETSTEHFPAARQPSRPRHQEPAGPLLPQGDRQHALFPTGHRERHRDRDGHDRRGTHRHPVETDQRDRAPRQQVHGGITVALLASSALTGTGLRGTGPSGTSAHCGWAAWSHLFYAPSASHLTERTRSPPEWLDLEYLRNSVFLQKTSDASRLLYQFTHVQLGVPACCSPAPAGRRSEVGPTSSSTHLSLLSTETETARDYATPQATTPRRSITRARLHADGRARPLPLRVRHHCQTDRRAEGGSPAHQHSSAVEQGAGQDHHKLKSKVKKMADQIRAMQDKLSCTASASGGVHRTAVGPRQAIPSEDDDEPDHDTTGGRPLPPEPPRHSSFEPRQQRKRRFGEPQTARPSGAELGRLAIQAMQLHFEADSADRPHTADESSAGPVRALHQSELRHHRPYLHAGEHAGGSRRLHLRTPLMLSPDATRPTTTTVSFHFPFSFSFIESV
ncbi:unnamed protein product [Microthlaspi erraticum]|uniref:Uncharacterized protein n=1 Tax=Microthlaspi erraticum TaxID=1685480 RepID=A0A6D2JTW6_9BRAS|nr:unnamed protein product [Microthlaspi erraticum]